MEQREFVLIEVPQDKDFEEFDSVERRAYILEKIFESGRLYPVKQNTLADKFNVCQATVSKDFNAVHTYLREDYGKMAKEQMSAAFERIYTALLEEDEYKAWKVYNDFLERMFDTGTIDKEPDKVEVSGRPRIEIVEVDDGEESD